MSAFPKMLLTNAGIILQAKVQGGVTLELTRIGLGDGNLNGQPISLLKKLINQTASVPIMDNKQIMNSDTLQVPGFFSNKDIQVGFYWREFGVFANDPDSGEILYAYSNAGNAGDYIPTIADQRIEQLIYASFTVQNAENVNITIPQSDTFILKKEKGAENGVAPLNKDGVLEIKYGGTEANDSQNALYNLGCEVRRNYFDNPDFKINQEKAEYNIPISMGKIVDRWYSEGIGDCEYTENGIITNNQYARQMWLSSTITAGKWTVSALCTGDIIVEFGKYGYEDIEVHASSTNYDNGLASVTFDIPQSLLDQISYNDYIYIMCKSGLGTNKGLLKYVKFEKGETQTLARKLEDDSWEQLEKSDYDIQLLKCQRYREIIDIPINSFIPAFTYSTELEKVQFNLPFKVTKASDKITVTFDDSDTGRFVSSKGTFNVLNTTARMINEMFAGCVAEIEGLDTPAFGWIDWLGKVIVSCEPL